MTRFFGSGSYKRSIYSFFYFDSRTMLSNYELFDDDDDKNGY